MSLTRKQKNRVLITLMSVAAAALFGFMCFALVSYINTTNMQNAQETAYQAAHPVPQVNAQKYEHVNTSNDGQFDHYCVGADGMWIGPEAGEFAVVPNDPVCK